MPDTFDGKITFLFNHAPRMKAILHVGKVAAPFKNMHAQTEMTIQQGNDHFEIAVNGDQITYHSKNSHLKSLGLDAPITVTDKDLAQKMSAAIRDAFDDQGNLIRGKARFATQFGMYLQQKLVGPHGAREGTDGQYYPREERSGHNFDFEKNPFAAGQKRLHVDEELEFANILMGKPHKIDLNAEQTPGPSLFKPYELNPAFHKVQIEGGFKEDVIKAQAVYPNPLIAQWYDDPFKYPAGEVYAAKIAQAARKAVKQVLEDEVVTRPEAFKLAALQEKLFEFVMKFRVDHPLSEEAKQKLIAENEKPLIQLAEDVITASLPPVRTPVVFKDKPKNGRH